MPVAPTASQYKVKVCSAVDVLKMACTKELRVEAPPRCGSSPKGMRIFYFLFFIPAGEAIAEALSNNRRIWLETKAFSKRKRKKINKKRKKKQGSSVLNAVGLGVEAENLTDSVWEIRRMKCGDEQETVLAARPGAVSVNHPPPPLVTVWGNVTLRPPPVLTAPPPARIDPIQARPAAVDTIPPPSRSRRPSRWTPQPGDVR